MCTLYATHCVQSNPNSLTTKLEDIPMNFFLTKNKNNFKFMGSPAWVDFDFLEVTQN